MTQLERYQPELTERDLARIYKVAGVLAKQTVGIPTALQGKPDAIAAMGITAFAAGMPLNHLTINEFPIIEGRVEPSAKVCQGLAERRGHKVTLIEYGPERAIVDARRHGTTDTVRIIWTIDMARQAGLLDEWVEHWITVTGSDGKDRNRKETFVLGRDGVDVPDWVTTEVAAGNTKRRENWHRYPADMLYSRATKRAVKAIAADALLGLPEEHWRDDDVVVDGEIVDAGEAPQQPPCDDDVADAELVEEGDDAFTPAPPPVPTVRTVSAAWVDGFIEHCASLELSPPERDALIRTATAGRVDNPGEVLRGDEATQVQRLYEQLRDHAVVFQRDEQGAVSIAEAEPYDGDDEGEDARGLFG